MKKWRAAFLLPTLIILMAAAPGWTQPPADFGDLADPPVPTLRLSLAGASGRVGPYHLDTAHEWIGLTPTSTTTTEPDAKPADEDDGLVEIENVRFNGLAARTGRVSVSVTTDTSPDIRYLNVAADLNGDGVFATYSIGATVQYEWLVVNLPIAFRGETKMVTSLFTLTAPAVMANKVRATLTTEKIFPSIFGAGGWDGSGPAGGFARGETEDYAGVPIVNANYDLNSAGVHPVPPILPKPPFNPISPPTKRVGDKMGPRGPVTEVPVYEPPSRPDDGMAPYTPESPAPERSNEPEPNPVTDSGSLSGVPDIKQGPNECVPAATANSLSYLLNKAGQKPADGDAFDKDLFEKLKEAMKTTAENGTRVATDNPAENDFLKGKASAQITGALRNAKVTTGTANPSVDSICDAVAAGQDVEIVVTCYDKAGNAVGHHMVTVVGFVKKADGTVELKIHDPNNTKPGDQPGVSAKPPRESTITLVPCAAGDASKGGIRVKGMARDGKNPDVNDDGDTFVIDQMFVEYLAQGGAPVKTTGGAGLHQEGGRVTLGATTQGGKADGLVYQWIKDGVDLEGANQSTYIIASASLLDSGDYACHVYDPAADTWGISAPVHLVILPAGSVPAAGTTALALLALVLALLAWLAMRRSQTTRHSGR